MFEKVFVISSIAAWLTTDWIVELHLMDSSLLFSPPGCSVDACYSAGLASTTRIFNSLDSSALFLLCVSFHRASHDFWCLKKELSINRSHRVLTIRTTVEIYNAFSTSISLIFSIASEEVLLVNSRMLVTTKYRLIVLTTPVRVWRGSPGSTKDQLLAAADSFVWEGLFRSSLWIDSWGLHCTRDG